MRKNWSLTRAWAGRGATIVVLASAVIANASIAMAQDVIDPLRLPNFVAETVEGDPVSYPGGLEGAHNLVLFGFLREHQDVLETWRPVANELATISPDFAVYEVPVLAGLPGIAKFGIRSGFRRGITDPNRRRTLTLYFAANEAAQVLKAALSIETNNDAHALLIDRDGNVLWRDTGSFSETKWSTLTDTIANK